MSQRNDQNEVNFRFEAAIKEYECLRSELVTRMEKQHDVTNFAIGLTAGVLAITQIFANSAQKNFDVLVFILPIISLIFSAFSLMILEHDAVITTIQAFIDEMGLEMERYSTVLKSPGVWRWNRHGSSWQLTSSNNIYARLMSVSKHGMTFIPNICILCSYFYIRLLNSFSFGLDTAIFILALIIFLMVIRSAVYASTLYGRLISKEKLKKHH